MTPTLTMADRMRGIIIGTAVGDTLGLPAEGLSRARISRMFPGPWRQRFIFGRGMMSDDTEHTAFVAHSLLDAPASPELFAKKLAMRLRLWLMTLPAGVGLATLRSILKMCVGISPSKSGVHSAGNGPAMRVSLLGAFFCDDPELMEHYIEASTLMTHTDPRALTGARAIAHTVAWIVRENLTQRPEPVSFITMLRDMGDDKEWAALVDAIERAIKDEMSVDSFAESIEAGGRVSGYTYRTVPLALYAWYRHFGDYEATLVSVLNCGGDTDTAGAIAGAMAGAVTSENGIPESWVNGIADWPRDAGYLGRLADALTALRVSGEAKSVGYFWPGLLIRNPFFLVMVLLHGIRRLLPPY